MRFEMNYRSRVIEIVKTLQNSVEVKILLIGDIPNKVEADVSTNGRISCDYENASDFNTPKKQGLKDANDLDRRVKNFISTEELNELRDKSYSVYNELMEIYKKKANIDIK